jgi:16S rRNA (guanine1207-N2)-methyltransferase
VFCREGLDIGTRAFLPHLPRDLGRARVADLGCGNGVLAIASALANPDAQYTWWTSRTWRCNRPARTGRPHWANEAAIQAAMAWRGWRSSRWTWCCATRRSTSSRWSATSCLAHVPAGTRSAGGGGALYIVGNRHLGYHSKLARLFRGVEQVAATPKFVCSRPAK